MTLPTTTPIRRARPRLARAVIAAAVTGACVLAWLPSCSNGDPGPAPALTREALMDPETCASCHGDHHREWSGSMHAYASDDPVFVAMNARGQRETNGKLGAFCVQCHAPMAVRTGATTDGLNLASLPAPMKGITCFFCHSADGVEGTHNDPLHLATDGALRASLANPLLTGAHPAQYSPLHDRDRVESSSMCGSCHDVQNQAGVDIEKTFGEWKGAIYAHDVAGQRLTCGGCHMPGSDALAANVPGAPVRRVHDHSMPGVDLALTDFPEADAQRKLVQQNLDPALVAKLCVSPPQSGDAVAVTLDNAFVGHAWPSGAAQDRRAWLEVVAYAKGQVVFQSGVVPDAQSVTSLPDPSLWLLRTSMTDAAGKEVHMMWDAAKTLDTLLPPSVTNDPQDPRYYHSVTRTFAAPPSIDRVTARVRLVPIGLDVLDDLIASGDLDASYRAKMPIFTLGGTEVPISKAR